MKRYQFARIKLLHTSKRKAVERTVSIAAEHADEHQRHTPPSEPVALSKSAISPHIPTTQMPISEQGSVANTPPFQPISQQHQNKFSSLISTDLTYIPIRLKTVKRPIAPAINLRYRKKRRFPLWKHALIIVLTICIILTGAIFAYYQVEIAPSLNNILGHTAIRNHQQDTPNQTGSGTGSRINIALFGSDTDNKFDIQNGEGYLAQTVMLITIDPQSGQIGMLSISRDMQVWDPIYGYPKLDEVFMHAFQGNTLQEQVAAAAGHTMDVIEENYGIPIHYYTWIGLQGFIKVIDTAGGIDVDVIHPMVDDAYPDDIHNANHYDYKRLYLAPGPQHLDGTQALEYVRTRHSDLIGDIGRTMRQQQVLEQLKIKLTSNDMLGNASEYLKDMDGFLQTDMQLADILNLANYIRKIDTNTISRVTLGPPDYAYLIEGTTNFAPLCDEVNQLIAEMFAVTPDCIPQTDQTEQKPAITPVSTPTDLEGS